MVRIACDIFGREVIAGDDERGRICDVLFDDRTWSLRYLVICPDSGNGRPELLLPLDYCRDMDLSARMPVLCRYAGCTFRALKPIESDPPVSRQHPSSRSAKRPLIPYDDYGRNWGAISIPMIAQWYFSALCSAAARDNIYQQRRFDSHLRSSREVIGYRLQASDGTTGHAIDLLFGGADQMIHYLVVGLSRLWRKTRVLLPGRRVRGICWSPMRISTGLSKNAIRSLPHDGHWQKDSVAAGAASGNAPEIPPG